LRFPSQRLRRRAIGKQIGAPSICEECGFFNFSQLVTPGVC
jgi:hypothetical protein